MAITNYLVHFKTEATYESNKDQLRNDAVAFVKDATIIHTHGTDYHCGSGPVALESDLANYATTSALTSGLAGKANTSHTHSISQISGLQTELDSKLESVSLADLGITATAAELNYVDGVTSNIQTQLNNKAASSHNHSAANITSGTLDLARIPSITDAKITSVSASKITGTIPQANLPSYVDDVLEYRSKSSFPQTGEAGKIYVDTTTNLTYRWGGSSYVEISPSIALGETSSTAYRGDKGKIAYDHSQATGNPHNLTLSNLGISATAAEINKLDGLATTATELGYVHGVTSAIQTQLNGKANASALAAYALKDGSNASGSWGINISGIANRAVYLTSTYTGSGGLQPPSYFNGMGLKVNMMNAPVTYSDVIVVNGYGGQGSDVPYVNALAFQKTANAHGEVYHARGDYGGSSWGTWYKFLDEYNYASYTVTKTGSGASGTWNINISGTAASANSVAWNNVSGKPSSFTPSAHNQASNTITALTGYSEGTATTTLTASMSLNAALASLQNQIQTKQAAGSYAAASHTHTASQVSGLAKVATSGSYNDLTNKPSIPAAYTLPVATASVLGGVKIGSGVTISSGVISVSCSSIGAATASHTHSQYLTSSSLSGYATQSWVNSQGFIKSATDTKNTAGSVETSSKLFLVGALSQAASSITYSNSSVYTQSGQLYATKMYATTGFYETSDARLKDFKEDIKALDTVDQIPTKYFTWKKEYVDKNSDSKLHIGTSAQEIQKLYPDLVTENEDGVLSVDYARLSIIALAAIKELKAQIDELKSKN